MKRERTFIVQQSLSNFINPAYWNLLTKSWILRLRFRTFIALMALGIRNPHQLLTRALPGK